MSPPTARCELIDAQSAANCRGGRPGEGPHWGLPQALLLTLELEPGDAVTLQRDATSSSEAPSLSWKERERRPWLTTTLEETAGGSTERVDVGHF